jgi:hypothetical protein
MTAKPTQDGAFIIVPKGGNDHEAIYRTQKVESLLKVAVGIQKGWDFHEAEVIAKRTTTSSGPKNSIPQVVASGNTM